MFTCPGLGIYHRGRIVTWHMQSPGLSPSTGLQSKKLLFLYISVLTLPSTSKKPSWKVRQNWISIISLFNHLISVWVLIYTISFTRLGPGISIPGQRETWKYWWNTCYNKQLLSFICDSCELSHSEPIPTTFTMTDKLSLVPCSLINALLCVQDMKMNKTLACPQGVSRLVDKEQKK